MKITTTHLFLGAIVLLIVSQGENIRRNVQVSAREEAKKRDISETVRESKIEEKEAEKLSTIAVNRYKNNCVFVVDAEKDVDSYFYPGQVVTASKLKRALRPGLVVCNRLGDTAVVSSQGSIDKIARVIDKDLSKLPKTLQLK